MNYKTQLNKSFIHPTTLKLIILSVLFSVSGLKAQFNETIRTGRPGQAIGPYGVGKNVLQTQTGLDFGGFTENNLTSNYFAPNTVIRFGITKHVDLNTGLEYRFDRFENNGISKQISGLSLNSWGARVNIFEGRDYLPAIGIQVTMKLPYVSANYDFKYVAPRMLLIVHQKISDKLSAFGNVAINYNGDNAKPLGQYVLNLGYSLTEKWGVFIENYGVFERNRFENRWDTGLAFMVNNNLQLDIYGGIGNNNGLFDYFTSIGVSWRIVTLREKMNH